MRRTLLPILLAACAAPPEPVPDLPELALGYETAAALVVPQRATETSPPCRMMLSVFAAARPADATPLDALATTVLADEGAPFRGGSPALRGWFVPTPPLAPPTGGTVRQTTALVASDLVTRVTFVGRDLPDLLLRRDGAELVVGLRRGDPDRQLAIARTAPADGRLCLFVAPLTLPTGLAIVLELGPPTDDAELARAREQAASSTATSPEPTTTHEWSAALLQRAVGREARRRALLGLAQRFELERCVDLILCADERLLRTMAEGVPPDVANAYPAEQAIWYALLPTLQRDEAAPALFASARRHLGALAMAPTSFEFVLDTNASEDEFAAAILARNRAALDARAADVRCAAVDWLVARGHELPGYDPLAERAVRRAALEALEEEKR